jgi:hypothetical protein
MPRTPTQPRRSAPAAVGAPDLATLPRRVNRRDGADLVTRLYFPVSHRTLEAWPLGWRHVGGYAVCETADLLAEAERRFNAAPVIRGGRTRGPSELAQRAVPAPI